PVFSACPSSDLSAVLSDLPVLTLPVCPPITDTLPAPCRMVCCTDGSPGFHPSCLSIVYGFVFSLSLVGLFSVGVGLRVLPLPACPSFTDYSACSLSDGLLNGRISRFRL